MVLRTIIILSSKATVQIFFDLASITFSVSSDDRHHGGVTGDEGDDQHGRKAPSKQSRIGRVQVT